MMVKSFIVWFLSVFRIGDLAGDEREVWRYMVVSLWFASIAYWLMVNQPGNYLVYLDVTLAVSNFGLAYREYQQMGKQKRKRS